MNCQKVKDLMLEYAEGSLPRREHAEFEAHLAACDGCAEAMRREKQIEARLSASFRESVRTLSLGEQGHAKLLDALARPAKPAQPAWARILARRWIELTAAFGATVALLAVLVWLGTQRHAQPRSQPLAVETPSMQVPETRSTIQIRLPSVIRSYTFHRDGDFVVDTLVEQTNLVNVTLWGQINASTEPKANEKKMPL
jgi:anti-sigma factor RsiW